MIYLGRSAQTISSKYYVLLFPLNLIITIIVILLVYSTVYSDVITIVLIIVLLLLLYLTRISNLTDYLSEMKSSGATVGLR